MSQMRFNRHSVEMQLSKNNQHNHNGDAEGGSALSVMVISMIESIIISNDDDIKYRFYSLDR